MACSCCDICARSDMRDPHALMLQAEQHGGRIGDLLPKIVGPSDVAKLKRDLDPAMTTTNEAVKKCTTLDEPTRTAWGLFFAAWGAYREDWDSVLGFGSANRYDEGIAFQAQLAQWQELLRAKCSIPGPAVIDPHANEEAPASVLKWAAGAVIVVSLVYGAHLVLK